MRPYGSQSNTRGILAGFDAAQGEFRDLVSPLSTWHCTRSAEALAFGTHGYTEGSSPELLIQQDAPRAASHLMAVLEIHPDPTSEQPWNVPCP